jgi:hypothetical protein
MCSLSATGLIAASCGQPAPRTVDATAAVVPPERTESADAGADETASGPPVPAEKSLDSRLGKIPTQQDLDEFFSTATRLVVEEVNPEDDLAELVETVAHEDLSAVRSALAIDDSGDFEFAGCAGDIRVTLYRADDLIAELWQRARRLHWDKWRGDAVLQNPKGLSDWLHAKGVGLLGRELNGYEKDEAEVRLQESRWAAAIPASIKAMWNWDYYDQMPGQDKYLERLGKAIEKAIPDPSERALVLFEWFSAGARKPNGGFPSYELAVAELLSRIPLDVLIAAVRRSGLTEGQQRGARRYFRHIARSDPSRATSIPSDLVERPLARQLPEEKDHGLDAPCLIDWGFGTLDVRIGGEPVYVSVDGHVVAQGFDEYRLRPGTYEVSVDIVYNGVKGRRRVTIEEGKTVHLEARDFVGSKASCTDQKSMTKCFEIRPKDGIDRFRFGMSQAEIKGARSATDAPFLLRVDDVYEVGVDCSGVVKSVKLLLGKVPAGSCLQVGGKKMKVPTRVEELFKLFPGCKEDDKVWLGAKPTDCGDNVMLMTSCSGDLSIIVRDPHRSSFNTFCCAGENPEPPLPEWGEKDNPAIYRREFERGCWKLKPQGAEPGEPAELIVPLRDDRESLTEGE